MVSAVWGFVSTTGVPPAAGTACNPSEPDPANTMTSSRPEVAPANVPGTWVNVRGVVPVSATCLSVPSSVTNPIRSPSGEKNGLLPFSVPAIATASKLFSDRRYSLVVPPESPTKTSSEPSGDSANGAVQESPIRTPGGNVTDSRVVRTEDAAGASVRSQRAASDAAASRTKAAALIQTRDRRGVRFGSRSAPADTAVPAST